MINQPSVSVALSTVSYMCMTVSCLLSASCLYTHVASSTFLSVCLWTDRLPVCCLLTMSDLPIVGVSSFIVAKVRLSPLALIDVFRFPRYSSTNTIDLNQKCNLKIASVLLE